MSTSKRLRDEDVIAIFDCLYKDGKRPPSHLEFKIVPVGPSGLDLSPPPYEFEDGLYVLLRPQKKNKKEASQPKVPTHLEDFVMRDFPPETCSWSLSGPQFPGGTSKDSGVQQRYCYPKGRPEYSSQKGGALWTKRGEDGKDETEFRLLHVYLSPKRAANKGVPLSKEVIDSIKSPCKRHATLSKNRRARLKSKGVKVTPPHRAAKRSGKMVPRPLLPPNRLPPPLSPATWSTPTSPCSFAASHSLCASPVSFGPPPPLSYLECQNIFLQASANEHAVMPVEFQQGRIATPPPVPPIMCRFNQGEAQSISQSPITVSNIQDGDSVASTRKHSNKKYCSQMDKLDPLHDHLLWEMDASFDDDDFDVWNGSLPGIAPDIGAVKSSVSVHYQHVPGQTNLTTSTFSNAPSQAATHTGAPHGRHVPGRALTYHQRLTQHLEVFHHSLCKSIFAVPDRYQSDLVNVFSSWARKVALDPLGAIRIPGSVYQQEQHDLGFSGKRDKDVGSGASKESEDDDPRSDGHVKTGTGNTTDNSDVDASSSQKKRKASTVAV